MRVQHVWAKTGTSPVAFHNTTRDVALCPASEQRPGRVFVEIKGRKSVISNGPGRLWHSLIPVSGWGNDTRGRAPPRPRPRRPLAPTTSMRSRQPTDAGCEPALPLADRRVIARRWRHAGQRDLQSRPTLVCPATDPARWPAGPGSCWLRCASGLGISILGRDACPYRADSVRLGLRARHQGVVRTLKAPSEAVGYQPRNWPWLAHSVASEAATAAAITATTRRRTGRSADQRRPRATPRRVSPITM
jgi:hypothetical protein